MSANKSAGTGLAVTDNAPVVVADGRSQLHSNWASNPPYQLH